MEDFREDFYKDDKNRFAQNVISRNDPLETCMKRVAIEETHHCFNHKVDEVKPVTSQKSSGRCWIFAVMNAMRVPFVKKLEIEDFEFSQSYLFFCDKIERSNYFLNTIGKWNIHTTVCKFENFATIVIFREIFIFQHLFIKGVKLLIVVLCLSYFMIQSMMEVNGTWLQI